MFKCNFCGAEQDEKGEITKPGKTVTVPAKGKRGPKPKPFQAPKPEKKETEKSMWD